jgi:hypothetical protein
VTATVPDGRFVDELDLEQGRLDFAQLGSLVAAFEVGPQCVVVETEEGREIRITARRDLSTGRYVSEYERRVTVSTGGHTYQVWALTATYRACRDSELETCLTAAIEEVARIHVY